MAEVSYRVAHISDLHLAGEAEYRGYHDRPSLLAKAGLLMGAITRADLTTTMSTYGRQRLRALTRAMAGKSPYTKPYDGFVITGDLATTGHARDIAAAVKYLSGQGIPGAADPSVGFFPFPADRLAIVPGNHDRYMGRLCSPRSAEFEAGYHFGETWELPAKRHSDKRSTVNTAVIRRGQSDLGLGVVGADFSLPVNGFPNPFVHLGRGAVTDSILEDMVRNTRRLQREGCGVIWATHFPPLKKSWKLGLRGYKRVIGAALQCKVNLILSGHTHDPEIMLAAAEKPGFAGIRVITAGTPCGTGEGERSYYELNLTVHDSISGPGVRLSSHPKKMILFELPDRNWTNGSPGNIADFLPAY